MRTFTFACLYGTGSRDVAYAAVARSGFWYAIDGSRNVNFTYADLDDMPRPIDVETLPDSDFFTASRPITSESDLLREIEE